MTERVWRIAAHGKTQGPFSASEIEEKIIDNEIDAQYYIFKRGMHEWGRIDEQDEFSDLFDIPPPPPDDSEFFSEDNTREKEETEEEGELPPPKAKSRVAARIITGLMLGAAGFYAGGAMTGSMNSAILGAAAGFVVGLIVIRNPRKHRGKKKAKPLAWASLILGGIGLYAAYLTYNPDRWCIYAHFENRPEENTPMCFNTQPGCDTFAIDQTKMFGEGMAKGGINSSGLRGYACREVCASQWSCVQRALSLGR